MSLAGGKLKFIQMEPVTSLEVPNGALFIDSANFNSITYKNPSGINTSLTETTAESLLIKQMQSGEASIDRYAPVAKAASGKVFQAESDGEQAFVGFALEAVSGVDQLFNVLLVGVNLESAVSGLGFIPGQDVLIGENGEYVNSVSGFSNLDDSIIKVGVADCAAGVASPVATDLIVFSDVIARP